MNKRIVTLSIASILSLCTLASCSSDSVTNKKDSSGNQVIVTVGDEQYTANELFGQYLDTAAGISATFTAVYNVLTRKAVELTQNLNTSVSNRIDTFIEAASQAASTNGTTYKTELSAALKNAGADDLEDLKKIYELEEQKSEFEKQFYLNSIYEATMDDTAAVTELEKAENYQLMKEYVEEKNPYHVRHILVKTAAAGDSFFDGTISEQEAKNLANTIIDLAAGDKTFSQVAAYMSEDGSASDQGDVGIMDRDTSFVNEFKFACFQYDAFFNKKATRAADLNIPAQIKSFNDKEVNVKDTLTNTLGYIDFNVASDLIDFANVTKKDDGTKVKDGDESYYPRNILFNNYFNNHGLSVVVRGTSESIKDSTRFKHIEGLSKDTNNQNDILVDELGRPILVTRAGSGTDESGYQGVHFIVIEYSPVENTVNNAVRYYSTNVPKTTTNVSKDKRYVTFASADRDAYQQRATAITTNVKGYDSNVRFRFYETMLDQLKEKNIDVVIDERINQNIEKYISLTRASAENSAKESYATTWETYIRLLQLQTNLRKNNLISIDEIGNLWVK